MRILLALCVLVLAALPARAQDFPIPQLTGRVVDQANLLDVPTESRLEILLRQHEEKFGNQIVVVSLRSLEDRSIEEVGVALGRAWGIGQEGKDNGALLIVAPNEREVRIEVGYGLEGQLTDARSKTIIERAILPRFRDGDLQGGMVEGARAMLAALGDDPAGVVTSPAPPRLPSSPPSAEAEKQDDGFPWQFVFIGLFLVYFVFMRSTGRGGIMPYPIGVGGRSGGGFGGGGFSGGGGSFGGGGASGSW